MHETEKGRLSLGVEGMIEGDKVVCPWHAGNRSLKTGQAANNSDAKVAVYPIKTENGDVMVEMM